MIIPKNIHIIRMTFVSLLFATSFVSFQLASVSTAFGADPVNTTENIKPKEGDCRVDATAGEKLDKKNCGIIKMVIAVTNIMAGLAATVIVGSLVFAGIQYSMSGSDPSKVQLAKHRMVSAMIALAFLIFGFAFLQWLVPGGIV